MNNLELQKFLDFILCFHWNSLNARLDSHYEARSYEKKKYKKIKA